MTAVTVELGDITHLSFDVIVNAANSRLVPGGGVDGAIHAAGGPSIAIEAAVIAAEQGFLATGEAVVTGGGALPSRYVIHTVGPIWFQTDPEEAVALLGRCYENSLDLARDQHCRTIAFPNISTGVYGFPKPLAAETAIDAVTHWIDSNPDVMSEIRFVCFDVENQSLYEQLLGI